MKRLIPIISLLVSVASAAVAVPVPMAPPTAITPWYNSCFVDFAVPAGAADVRFVAEGSGGASTQYAKYAGLAYGLAQGTGPAPVNGEIQVNGLAPGVKITGVLQAVNELGPVPMYNLIDMADNVLNPNGPPPAGVMAMLGSDDGFTADGWHSINGQGLWSNKPVVLAQSAPFTISCLAGWKPTAGATQVWHSTFAAPTRFSAPVETAPAPENDYLGNNTITAVQSNHVTYSVIEQGLDTYPGHTSVFQMDRHLMWVAFDGGTFGTNNPLHTAHGYIALQPDKNFTLAADECLHLTWSVDSFNCDGRKAVEMIVQPADAPIEDFSSVDGTGKPMNAENQLVVCRFGIGNYQVTLADGMRTDGSGLGSFYSLDGSLGQAAFSPWRMRGANGKGRDDQSLLEVYIGASGIAVVENGIWQFYNGWNGHAPAWLTSGSLRVEFGGIVYHTNLCVADMAQWQPSDQYDVNPLAGQPGSDERHMCLAAVQVEPASAMPVAAQ